MLKYSILPSNDGADDSFVGLQSMAHRDELPAVQASQRTKPASARVARKAPEAVQQLSARVDGGVVRVEEQQWNGWGSVKLLWTFTVSGTEHSVLLKHGTVFGKRCISVDGKRLVKQSLNLLDDGSVHKLRVTRNLVATVAIVAELGHFRYVLYLNGNEARPVGEGDNERLLG